MENKNFFHFRKARASPVREGFPKSFKLWTAHVPKVQRDGKISLFLLNFKKKLVGVMFLKYFANCWLFFRGRSVKF